MKGYSAQARDMYMDRELEEHLERVYGDDEEEQICVDMNCDYQDDNSTYCCGAGYRDGEPVFPTCKTRIVGEIK